MQQYRAIKARHADAILFFRMGDFYEMFYEDAECASRELGLTLTSRNSGGAASVPLAGVPVKAAGDYLRRLVDLGHRVAICEQVEDPKLAKGVVKREVIETVTPGAVVAQDWLDGSRNNFLVAIQPGNPSGIAALDLSTGEFVLETVPVLDLEATVTRYGPREIVVPEDCDTTSLPSVPMITKRDAWEFDSSLAADDLQRHFRLFSLEGLGIQAGDTPALRASGALLKYALSLQPSGLPHVALPTVRRDGNTMPLDAMTKRNLELEQPLRTDNPGEPWRNLARSHRQDRYADGQAAAAPVAARSTQRHRTDH